MPRDRQRVFTLSTPGTGIYLVTIGVYATPQGAQREAAALDAAAHREVPTIWAWDNSREGVQQGFAQGNPDNVRWVIEPWNVCQ